MGWGVPPNWSSEKNSQPVLFGYCFKTTSLQQNHKKKDSQPRRCQFAQPHPQPHPPPVPGQHEVGVLMVCLSVDGVLLNHPCESPSFLCLFLFLFLLLLCFSMPCEVEDSSQSGLAAKTGVTAIATLFVTHAPMRHAAGQPRACAASQLRQLRCRMMRPSIKTRSCDSLDSLAAHA